MAHYQCVYVLLCDIEVKYISSVFNRSIGQYCNESGHMGKVIAIYN